MKLIDLFEDDDGSQPSKVVQHVVDIIEKECSEMLAAYRKTDRVLYRGSNKETFFAQEVIRQDRRPVEMDQDAHDLIVKAMKKMDLPTRANSLFVSANYGTAEVWGSMNAVFVPNGWTALVYDNLRGEYSFDELGIAASDIIDSQLDAEQSVDEMIIAIKELQPRKVTNAAGLVKILNSGAHDILINAPSYYRLSMMRKHSERTNAIAKKLGIEL